MKRTYFLDNDLSGRLATVLKALGEDVTYLREYFPADTADEVWIPKVAEKGWVIVTVDHKILTRPAERKALEDAKAIAFFIATSFLNLTIFNQVGKLSTMWPRITAAAEKSQPGRLYRVHLNGTIDLVTSK